MPTAITRASTLTDAPSYFPAVPGPVLVPGYRNFWDADTLSGVGSPLTSWANRVTGGSALTGTNAPTLRAGASHRYVEFDGVNDALRPPTGTTPTTPHTWFLLLRVPVLDGTRKVLVHSSASAAADRQAVAVSAAGAWTFANPNIIGSSAATTRWGVVTVVSDGASSRVGVDDRVESVGDAGSSTAGTNLLLGVYNGIYSRFDLGAFIDYPGVLSDADRLSTKLWLMERAAAM